ncbi:hypothetical protein PIB30_049121 [Stylosanthes scabra]|uniref:F-box domain-containing protein n=1 Tax=Stylosanthes scabra TaxID=79078 RepID=A0ABU6VGY0_9FABA|nr:hypothetical protein [Stylosanthes scabra]
MDNNGEINIVDRDQVFHDDILLEIFKRAEPKTATRCKVLGKTWNQLLNQHWFMKENTFSTDGTAMEWLLPVFFLCSSVVGASGISLALNTCYRELEDPAERLCRQAMSGYAFGYKKDIDNYYVANLSKCHIKDSFVHCNIFSSAEGEWKRSYIKDARIKVLSSSSVIHQEKAIWINMAGRHSTTGDDIVKIVENRPRGIPSIPIHVFGTYMLIVYEKVGPARRAINLLKTIIEVHKLNLLTKQGSIILGTEWLYDMSFKNSVLVSQGMLIP